MPTCRAPDVFLIHPFNPRAVIIITVVFLTIPLFTTAAPSAPKNDVECDLEVKKRDLCAPFSPYEWGLSRCVILKGEKLNFSCAVLQNVNVRYLFDFFFLCHCCTLSVSFPHLQITRYNHEREMMLQRRTKSLILFVK